MNVFSDLHHNSLFNSFRLLFEVRLGGQLFRPIGMEWAEKNFWAVYPHPETQRQYLSLDQRYMPIDGTRQLNQITENHLEYYEILDPEYNYNQKAITFDGFMSMPFDIVIASLPQHIEPFKRLCEIHPNKPKLIYQIGNQWNVGGSKVKNVMASAIVDNVPPDMNFITYHQEFDTTIFYPESNQWAINGRILDEVGSNKIYSFVNVFNGQSHFATDWQLFEQIERAMPDWNFKSYGGQCRDGSMNGSLELANKMREARFIWHTKNGGDGYGHVLHNASAVGRPLIVKKQYYAGKLGERLLIDGETCICIDGLSNDEIVSKINYYNEPARYANLCRLAYGNFTKVCNFDKEFEEIKTFLDHLQ